MAINSHVTVALLKIPLMKMVGFYIKLKMKQLKISKEKKSFVLGNVVEKLCDQIKYLLKSFLEYIIQLKKMEKLIV